jgi:hypothetical protein
VTRGEEKSDRIRLELRPVTAHGYVIEEAGLWKLLAVHTIVAGQCTKGKGVGRRGNKKIQTFFHLSVALVDNFVPTLRAVLS